MNADNTAAVLDTALQAHRAGICVLPPKENGTKAPDGNSLRDIALDKNLWSEYQERCSTEDEIRRAFARGKTGVGFVCGEVSGGLELFDFDDRDVFEAYRERARGAGLGEILDRLEAGYMEHTPNGVHLFYRCATPKGGKLAKREKADGTEKTLIELKGEGGFAIAAPSSGSVHESGKPYTLVSGSIDTIPTLSSTEREELHRVARTFCEMPGKDAEPQETACRSSKPTNGELRPGDDYTARTPWDDVLCPHGWVRLFTDSRGITHWRRPEKTIGTSATTNSKGTDRLICFSTSTPFESFDGSGPAPSYDKFGAYALLEHDGDFKVAARILAEQGYGSSGSAKAAANSEDGNSLESSECMERDEDWNPLLEFGAAVHGDPVPLEVFPPAISDYAAEVARVHKIPADLAAGVALGVLATSGQRRFVVQIGETHHEQLSLYLMPTAAPGERKAQAIRSMVFPIGNEERHLCDLERENIRRARQARAVGEKRVKYLQDQASKARDATKRANLAAEASTLERDLPPVPVEPRLTLDDATPEFVAKSLAEQGGRIAIFSEEAGSLVATFTGRYSKNGEGDIDVYLKGYDGGLVRVGRISREGSTVEEPAISIVVTPQPAIIDQIAAHGELRGRGLLGRFCIILPESRVGTRTYSNRSINIDARTAYSAGVDSILQRPLAEARRVPRLHLRGEALSVWAQFADDIEARQAEGGDLVSIADWASKHAGRVARIAGLFHLVRHAQHVDPASLAISSDDVVAAWAVGEWLQSHALAAFDRMGLDADSREAKRVLAWIRKEGELQFSLSTLHSSRRGKDRPASFLPALRILEERGFIREVQVERQGKQGRTPLPVFDVNPDTLTNITNIPSNSGR